MLDEQWRAPRLPAPTSCEGGTRNVATADPVLSKARRIQTGRGGFLGFHFRDEKLASLTLSLENCRRIMARVL